MWVVFFDAEDNGKIEGRDWIMGSRLFVQSLTDKPDYMVLLDMVGDADLNIYKERNSDNQLTNEIWRKADVLGYGDYFIPTEKYRMIDDHIPLSNLELLLSISLTLTIHTGTPPKILLIRYLLLVYK